MSKHLKCTCASKLCTDKFLPEALRRAEVAAANVVWRLQHQFVCSQRQMQRCCVLSQAAAPLTVPVAAAAAAALLAGCTNNGKIMWPGTRENHLLRAGHGARNEAEEA